MTEETATTTTTGQATTTEDDSTAKTKKQRTAEDHAAEVQTQARLAAQDPEKNDLPSAKDREKASALLPYAIGEWAGRPNFQCHECPFDTLSEETILDHIHMVHGPSNPPGTLPSQPPAQRLVDRFGAPLYPAGGEG